MISKLMVVLMTLVGSMAISLRPRSGEEPKRELKVAVVHMRQAFDKYDRLKDVEEELARIRSGYQAEVELIQSRIDKLRKAIPEMKRGSNLYYEKVDELRRAEAELRTTADWNQKAMTNRLAGFQIEMYADLVEAVQRYNKKHNFDAILKADETKFTEEEDPRMILLSIQGQVVLAHSNAIDITKEITELANQEYTWTCPKCNLPVRGKHCGKCGGRKP